MNTVIKKHLLPMIVSIGFALLGGSFAVAVQVVRGHLLDNALQVNINATLLIGLFLGALICCELISMYLFDRFRGRFLTRVVGNLRQLLFEVHMSGDVEKSNKQKNAEFVSLYSKQVEVLQDQYINLMPLIAEVVFKILLVGLALYWLSIPLLVLTSALLVLPLFVPKLIEKKLRFAQQEAIITYEDQLTKLLNWLSCYSLIKLNRIEPIVLDKFSKGMEKVVDADYTNRHMRYLSTLLSTCLSYFSHYLIMIGGIYYVSVGSLSAGQFFTVIGLVDQLSYPILSLSGFVHDFIAVGPVKEEINQLISLYHEATDTIEEGMLTYPIQLKNVNFGYTEHSHVIEELSLSVEKNDRLLITGPSGSGKTTLVKLIMGLLHPLKGQVLLGEKPVNQAMTLTNISVLSQQVEVLQDTLRNNLSLYKDIDDSELIKALKSVGLDSFASTNGLDSLIEPEGENLSGGQLRRLGLARALLKPSSILILDEPFANVDDQTIAIIEDSLGALQNKTIVMISHQVSSKCRSLFNKKVNLSN